MEKHVAQCPIGQPTGCHGAKRRQPVTANALESADEDGNSSLLSAPKGRSAFVIAFSKIANESLVVGAGTIVFQQPYNQSRGGSWPHTLSSFGLPRLYVH